GRGGRGRRSGSGGVRGGGRLPDQGGAQDQTREHGVLARGVRRPAAVWAHSIPRPRQPRALPAAPGAAKSHADKPSIEPPADPSSVSLTWLRFSQVAVSRKPAKPEATGPLTSGAYERPCTNRGVHTPRSPRDEKIIPCRRRR